MAWKRKDVVAVADLTPELGIGRVVVHGFVLSEHRKKGVGSELLRRAERRAEALDVPSLHACVPERNDAAQDFLAKRGFGKVRTFLDLVLHAEGLRPKRANLFSGHFEFFKPGQESLLTEIQNSVFSGSWGFCPNTPEDIAFYLDLTECRITDVLLIKNRNTTVGYSWFHKLSARPPEPRPRARIHMFGILPEYRGRGRAHALLWKSLDLLVQNGAESVELTVDSQNKAALSLYNRLGFKRKEEKFWYGKKIFRHKQGRPQDA